MMILDELGFRRARTFALEHLISFHCTSGDLRWAMAALALRSFSAMWVFGQDQLISWVRNAARRLGQKSAFPADNPDADIMVAAGGR